MPVHRAKKLSKYLRHKFPNEYPVMTKWQANKELFSSPRVYLDQNTLIDPKTDKTYKLK